MNIDIDKELETCFFSYAKQSGRDPSKILSKLLEQYLEDRYDYETGLASYQEYISSGRKGKTLAELSKELGLDD